jgi:hypothetical protein
VKKCKSVEILKDIIIVLLIASALFLGWESKLFGNSSVGAGGIAALFRGMSGAPAVNSPDAPPKAAEPDRPAAIAVTGGDGSRCGEKYDMGQLDLLYNGTARYFSEALGTAKEAEPTDAAAWRSALTSAGVYYEYISPVKLSILGDWFDADVTGDLGNMSVRRLCVTANGEKTRLFFQNDKTGVYYSVGTSVRGSIMDASKDYTANGAVFSFEKGVDSWAPGTLLLPEITAHPQLEVENPLNDNAKKDAVLLSLGVSDLGKSSYKSGDREYFVGEDFTLDVSADGTVNYDWTGDEPQAAGSTDNESDAIQKAYRMVSAQLGNCGENAAVYYDSSSALGSGGYKVLFRYIAAGGAVWLYGDGYAASVIVKGGRITGMTLRFRTYTDSTATELMPELQAAAAAKGDFMLVYRDNGDTDAGSALLQPAWVHLPLGT